MYYEDYYNDFDVSDEDLLYRKTIPKAHRYMGPSSEDSIFYGSDENDDVKFGAYSLQRAIHRRGIIKVQCHYIAPDFKTTMPNFRLKS